jgi:predicted  nucleic acid-binding Zn-ribbon protein
MTHKDYHEILKMAQGDLRAASISQQNKRIQAKLKELQILQEKLNDSLNEVPDAADNIDSLEVQIRTTFLAPDRERQRNINFAIEVI